MKCCPPSHDVILSILLIINFGGLSIHSGFAYTKTIEEDNKNQSRVELAGQIDQLGDGPCVFSLRKIPGLKVVNIDGNGRKCQGEIQVPFCRGLCKSMESGTHTFPYRDQEAYFCGLVEEKGSRNVTLDECEEGVEEYARFVEISSATDCQCQKMP